MSERENDLAHDGSRLRIRKNVERFAEPGQLSSTFPANRPLPRRARQEGFDLPAARARRTSHARAPRDLGQPRVSAARAEVPVLSRCNGCAASGPRVGSEAVPRRPPTWRREGEPARCSGVTSPWCWPYRRIGGRIVVGSLRRACRRTRRPPPEDPGDRGGCRGPPPDGSASSGSVSTALHVTPLQDAPVSFVESRRRRQPRRRWRSPAPASE